jgi:hypothetical protein
MNKTNLLILVFLFTISANVFAAKIPCEVGNIGPGGGYIFYCFNAAEKYLLKLKKGIEVSGFEADKKDLEGFYNFDDAIDACKNSKSGGVNDWILPNKILLNIMFIKMHKKGIKNPDITSFGNFADSFYWSSSVEDYDNIWIQNFEAGVQGTVSKRSYISVRCIRIF